MKPGSTSVLSKAKTTALALKLAINERETDIAILALSLREKDREIDTLREQWTTLNRDYDELQKRQTRVSLETVARKEQHRIKLLNLQNENRLLQTQLIAARQRYAEVLQSTSWRITGPLRKLVRLLRRR